MQAYQKEFISFIAGRGALRFGEFRTKSGRLSPYFFNAGELSSGADLRGLGSAYAAALVREFGKVDILYGPPYKGIPLAVAAAASLSLEHGLELSYCFHRKEKKDHGEGGLVVGRPPKPGDRVVLVDDVITAGTSVREAMDLLKAGGIGLSGILVALDRQERGMKSGKSALQEIEAETGVPVRSIIKLEHILEMLKAGALPGVDAECAAKIAAYRKEFGVA